MRGAWLLGLPLLALPGPAGAQEPGGGGLPLAAVLEAALERSPQMALAAERLAASAGDVLTAEGAFAAELSTSVVRTREEQPGIGSDGSVSALPRTVSDSYRLALTRQTRLGLLVQPELAITRTDPSHPSPVATNSASVGLQLLLPLWQDRGATGLRAAERAMEAVHTADRHALRHTAAASVLEAVAAYWEYVAAHQRAEVHRESEARAQRMVEETRILVAADERPAADLNQLLANVASKRMARIAAEQGVLEARRRLGLAMGLGPAETWRLGPADDDFPLPVPLEPDSALETRLVELALARRADLASAAEQQRAAEVLASGARDGLRPRLDLSVSVGYRGVETGTGLEEWIAPLYRNVPGMNSAVQLSYRLPVSGVEAQGRALRQQALAEQQRIQARALRDQIASGVAVAVQGLRRSVLAAAEADAAAEMYRLTVENERTKHQLDAATLFDVILAEDALTSARLGQVAARTGYALAVADLRYQTGTLVSLRDGKPVARVEDVLSIPDAAGR